MTFASTIEGRDHYLSDMILAQYSDTDLVRCMKLCDGYSGGCRSFSVSESERKCYLSSIKRRETSKDKFVYKKGFVYYEAV